MINNIQKQVFFYNIIHIFFLAYILKYNKNITITVMTVNILLGIYFADILTGILHYYFDNYKGNIDFFKTVSHKHFLDHHNDPGNVINNTFIEDINSATLTYPVVIIIYILLFLLKKTINIKNKYDVFVFITTFLPQFSNTTHKLCHRHTRNKRNLIYTFLMKLKLVLNNREHQIHHETGGAKNYALLTGWSNPLLNVIFKV